MISSKVNFARRIGPVKREKDNLLWNIQFSHAIIGDVNLGSVLSCAEVTRNLPTDLKGKFNVRPWFRYGKTIGSRILNYNKHLRNCGDLSYADIVAMSCDCDSSEFKHGHFGHVITGNMEIIQDSELRDLCTYGTKFRENPPLDVNRIRAQLKDEIGKLSVKICQKYRKSVSI